MKKLKIITIIISIICMLIYEIGFCNLFNILQGDYNFSLFRIIVYFAILFLYIRFSKCFIEETINTIKNNKRLY